MHCLSTNINMDSSLKCISCNIPISQLRIDFGNSKEEESKEYSKLEAVYAQSSSINSCLACKGNTYCCFHCSWNYPTPNSVYHWFDNEGLDYDVPGKMKSVEYVRKLYQSLAGARNIKAILCKLQDYAKKRFNSYFDQLASSIALLEYTLNFINQENIATAPDYCLLELGQLYFISGNSTKALDVLNQLSSSSPENKLKSWILILNYIGPKYFRNNSRLLDEITNTLKETIEASFEEIRLMVLIDYITNTSNFLKNLDPIQFYENYFSGHSAGQGDEKYYSLLDIARYDKSEDKLIHIQRLIHYTNVQFQFSIYLSNSYKLLSKFYRNNGNYEKALYLLELSTESYLKTTPKNSPDIIPLMLNLSKLKMKFSSVGVEHLLLHAIKVCDEFQLIQDKLSALELLKIFYTLSFKSKLAVHVSEYIEHLKSRPN